MATIIDPPGRMAYTNQRHLCSQYRCVYSSVGIPSNASASGFHLFTQQIIIKCPVYTGSLLFLHLPATSIGAHTKQFLKLHVYLGGHERACLSPRVHMYKCYVCVSMCIYTYVGICIHVYDCVHFHICMCIRVCTIHVHMYRAVSMPRCISVCVCVCFEINPALLMRPLFWWSVWKSSY